MDKRSRGRRTNDLRSDIHITRRRAVAGFLALGSAGVLPTSSRAECISPGSSHARFRSDDASFGKAQFGSVRFRTNEFPPIAVQSIGGPLPTWVEPDRCTVSPSLELVIARDASPIVSLAGVDPAMRIVLIDETVGDAAVPECLFALQGTAEDLDSLAETLVRICTGPTIVGIDLHDVRDAASFRSGSSARHMRLHGRGRAVVLQGSCADQLSSFQARKVLHGLENDGYDGGLFVAVMISKVPTSGTADVHWPPMFLYDFDTLMRSLAPPEADRPFMVTAFSGASRDAVVIVAFDGRNEHPARGSLTYVAK